MTSIAAPAIREQDYFDEFTRTGADTLGGRYLRQFWHPVARVVDLAPGCATTVQLLSERFTLYRGESGTFHLTEHHCPHRRTQLSVGFVEGEDIRCLYHGWKFGADGRCNERPAEGSTGNIRIQTFPAQEFLGLVYVYIGQGDAPSFPPYPGFQVDGVVETTKQFFPCNHFQSWENDWDLFHAAWTHKTGEIHGPASGPGRHAFYDSMVRTEHYEEMDYGVVRTVQVMGSMTNASVLFMPMTVRLLIPTFNELGRHGGPQFRETYLIHTPIDDNSHDVFLTQLVPVTGAAAEAYLETYAAVEAMRNSRRAPEDIGRDILAGHGALKDHIDHPVFVALEDILAHCGQGTIVDRTKEKLGRSDSGVVYLRRLMARELAAFAEHRDKRWAFMEQLPEGLAADVFAIAETSEVNANE